MKLSACAWIFSAMAMCTVYAQQPAPNTSAPDTAAGQQTQTQTQTRTIQMAPARATLNHGLDAKKAKQGDTVTAKLQDDVKIPDAPELPKNTVLMGHVDQVQVSEHKSDSVIQVTFDKAQLKNGQQVPIKATVMQIAPPVNAMMMGQPAGGGSPAAPVASPSMPAPSSGGTGGGTQSSSAPPLTPAPGMSSAPAPDQTLQSQQQQGVPGVELKSDIHEQDSATFSSKGRNVHLPDGTQMQFAVAVVPPNTQIK